MKKAMLIAVLVLIPLAALAQHRQTVVIPTPPQSDSTQGSWTYYTTGSQSGYVYSQPVPNRAGAGAWSLQTDYGSGQQTWVHQNNGFINTYPTTTDDD
jgi:hypothetical protein